MKLSPREKAQMQKYLGAIEDFPEDYLVWLPKFLNSNTAFEVNKDQLINALGEPWHVTDAAGEPALNSTWQAYGGVFRPPSFRVDYLGVVHLEGLVSVSAAPASSTIFTLPAGYRPPYQKMYAVTGYNGTYQITRVDVTTTGLVQLINPGFATFTATTHFISLDGIYFRIS